VTSLLFERNLARFAAARALSLLGSGRGAGIGPLRLTDLDEPHAPGAGWHHVVPSLSGICGSDLATLEGRASRYFEDLVSFPFVPGHEVVGVLGGPATSATDAPLEAGSRVVIQPVLGCRARGITPLCPACALDEVGGCERVSFGHLHPGLQTGYCSDTGGGWSTAGLVAHESQLYGVPVDLTDEDAVMVEPLACALHAAFRPRIAGGETVAVLGAGTVGLALTASLAYLARNELLPEPRAIVVGGRYAHQRAMAAELGATETYAPEHLTRAVRRHTGSLAIGGAAGTARLSGGADVVFDCVGSSESLAQSLAMIRPRGRVVMVGMPGSVHVDLASLWHRETEVLGAYAYGTEELASPDGPTRRRTFDLALEAAAALRIGQLVSATYPLERFEEAIGHAGAAGRRGAVKIAFDLRSERRAEQAAVDRREAARRAETTKGTHR
jgi:threonine dehydrogenase-like Zn-dependent dehydrogenase